MSDSYKCEFCKNVFTDRGTSKGCTINACPNKASKSEMKRQNIQRGKPMMEAMSDIEEAKKQYPI